MKRKNIYNAAPFSRTAKKYIENQMVRRGKTRQEAKLSAEYGEGYMLAAWLLTKPKNPRRRASAPELFYNKNYGLLSK